MRPNDGRVIPTFLTQALGDDLTVYGDGSQTRSFCYVSDMIDGLLTLLHSDVEEPVNIGNPDERTINELAEVIIELAGSESGIRYEELPPQDPEVRRPDITKAREELNWEPKVSLKDGLQEAITYFQA